MIREMIEAATGQSMDAKEMLAIGERNYNLLRIFAEKAGYTRADDKLHQRFHETQPSTGYKIYGYGKYGPDKKRAELLDISEVM